MNLKQQLESVLGREIPVRYESELVELAECDLKEARSRLERNSRAVDIAAVLKGEMRPAGPLLFVVSEFRGGFWIRLLEGLKRS